MQHALDLVFTPDGDHLIYGPSHHKIFILECDSSTVVRALSTPEGLGSYAFSLSISPAGEFLLASSGTWTGLMKVFDLHTSATSDRPVNRFTGTSGRGHSGWSNDNLYIASLVSGRIRLYDATVVNSRWIAGQAASASEDGTDCVPVIAGDKSWIATARKGVVTIWKTRKDARGQWISMCHRTWKASFSAPYPKMAISHDQQFLVAACDYEGRALIWTVEAEDQQPVAFDVPENVMKVAFPPVDGSSWFAMAFNNSGVQIRKAGTGELLRTFCLDGDSCARSLAISPDASAIASGHESGKIRVWDIETGEIMHTLENSVDAAVREVAFFADGKLAAYNHDWPWKDNVSQLTTWNLADQSSLSHPLHHHRGQTSRGTMSPVSDCFAAVTSVDYDDLIHLGNLTTGQWLPGVLRGRSSPVHSLVFSSDGEWLVASFYDGVVKIWDTAKMRIAAPVLQRDGWLVGTSGQRLMWIPEHLRRDLEWEDDALIGTLGVEHPTTLEIANLREDDWLAFGAPRRM